MTEGALQEGGKAGEGSLAELARCRIFVIAQALEPDAEAELMYPLVNLTSSV